MKLVTIQTKAAYESLVKNGYLVADEKRINLLKYGVPYSFIIKNMLGMENAFGATYPLWTWVKYGKIICPPKNKLLGFFPKDEDEIVKITFTKKDEDVLVSDYVKYHFLLTNEYLPVSIEDKLKFDKIMLKNKVTKEDLLAFIRRDKFETFRTDSEFNTINNLIQDSYKNIFVNKGDFLQGTVWDIKKQDIINVEFINRTSCSKKKSVDYRKLHIKNLKRK